MTTELNASQTERGAETGTNVGQPWEAKFMNLDCLLEPEPEYPRDDWSRGRNQLRESVRPEVEALQARVRELENMLEILEWSGVDPRNVSACPVCEHTPRIGHHKECALRATLEGKD